MAVSSKNPFPAEGPMAKKHIFRGIFFGVWTLLLLAALLLCPAYLIGASEESSSSQMSKNGFYTLTKKGELFSLRASGADIRAILHDLSRETGIPIAVEPNFKAKISVNLCDAPMEKLIKTLAENWGIVYVRSSLDGSLQGRIQKVTVARTQAKDDIRNKPEEQPPSLPAQNDHLPDARPIVTPDTVGSNGNNLPDQNIKPEKFRADQLAIKFDGKLSDAEIQSIVNQAGLSIKQHIAAINYYILSIPSEKSVSTLRHQFETMQGVTVAEPNYIIPLQFIPNDIHFDKQWALNNTGQTGGLPEADISALDAWGLGPATSDVIIAIIDTGVDYMHEDLNGNFWHNSSEVPDNGLDDDGNGFVDDYRGWDFVNNSNKVVDLHGHGTQVAGIIGAIVDNGAGISGLSHNCRLMPVRAGYKNAIGDAVLESVDAAKAIIYAADNGASILNLSWGDTSRSSLIADALEYAAAKELLIVAAAGNSNTSNFLYPAALNNNAIIAVGATDAQDEKSSFSNYGNWVDVSAPGSSIYTTVLENSYSLINGTSMAVSHVSAAAALVMGHFPELSTISVKARILRSVDRLVSLEGKNATAGRINAYKALSDNFTEPYIVSISPRQAHEGDVITISGDCFGDSQLGGTVWFTPDVPGPVVSWSTTEIVVTAPPDARTGPLVVKTASGRTSNEVEFGVLFQYYNESLQGKEFIGNGKAQGWQADDRTWQYTLPFEFPFYGKTYNSVYVCSNGYLDFTDGDASYQNSIDNLKDRTMIAPYWADLTTNGNAQPDEDIYIHSPAPDTICFRWVAEDYDTGNPVNVEAVLHQNGTIAFHYGSGNKNLQPTIAISGGTGQAFFVASHDGAYDLNQAQSQLFELIEQSLTTTVSIPLNAGWNLISLPVEPEDTEISQVLGEVERCVESVWGYDSGAWKVYLPQNTSFSDLETLTTGNGYWVKMNEAGKAIDIQGHVSDTVLDLSPGWNLVGFSVFQSAPVAEILADIEGDATSIWAYENGAWKVFDSRYPSLSDLQEVEPGMGYWINF